ncbi:hypothetical protein BGZ58_008249 [Dissophora ornata]|nr:hypothetical protein BGZ58_008249 [Dissophora ornata]
MSTSALDAMATDNAPSGQTNDAFVATWLERQDLPEKEEQSSWEDADDIPTEELSFLIGCDVMDSSSKLDPDEEFSYPLEQQYSSGHLYYTSPSQIPSYRHSISFDTTSTRLDDHISYSDPTDQYQMFGQYIDPAQQMQQYRLQHYPYVDHHVRRQISVPPLDNEPSSSFVYGPPIRSAHELAWERHNYYQRLQQEEEELALKMRQERLQRQEQQRQTQQDSYVVRAGSVNRLASPSLLSRETSRALGICRSNTLLGAAAAKNMSSVEKNVVIRPAMFLTKVNNGETTMNADYSTTSANNIGLTTSQTMPVETVTPAAPTLSRKKTLKDHLSPSLRSLARHCSSRFGGGSSGTRPNSFLSPKSGPILEHPQEEERSRTPSSRPASPVLDSTRMTDFKPLRAGPETTEILKQSQQQQQQQQQKQQQEQQPSQQRCPTPTGERVRAHRRRTLFRSNTTQAPSSTLMSTMAPDHGRTRNRADTLPNRKNNSMRLANGRRRDISTFFSDVTPENVDDASRATTTAPETLRRHMSTPVLPIRTAESRPSSPDLQAPNGEEGEEEEYGLTLRKQIVSIFSLGRKSSSSKKTKNATPAMSVSPSSHCLSPLAVEAQETLPDLFNQQQTMNSREEKEDDYGYYEEEEGQIGQKMMEDHIAFMLVPKSRYEFQPLLVQ